MFQWSATSLPRAWHADHVSLARLATLLAVVVVATSVINTARAGRDEVLVRLQAAREELPDPIAWAARRAEIKEGFLRAAGMWPLPTRKPPAVIRHSRREYGDYSVENIALATLPGLYLTGNLYRPLSPSKAMPIVLCPHGHYRPHGRLRPDQQYRCAQLARMGAMVLSYSMVGWDDSRQTTHDDPNVLALQTWNSVRAIDWLVMQPGVDPYQVAVTGSSGGGTQSLYVALVDERVKVCVPVVIVYPWSGPEGCKCEGGLPVLETSGSNIIEASASLAPRPQLIISVGRASADNPAQDPTHDFPQVGLPFVQHVYRLHDAADALESVHLANEGHDYGPAKRGPMYAFLAKHLGLTIIAEDPAAITIEPAEALVVFDGEHPLPEGAIEGPAASAAALKQALVAAEPVLDEKALFTPAGRPSAGQPIRSESPAAQIKIVTRDRGTGVPTPCRINVVGGDGQFYQPVADRLTTYALTGQWPHQGWGNRVGKSPTRYYGRFFYSTGEVTVGVPRGPCRIEVNKGFEYRPVVHQLEVADGDSLTIDLSLEPTGAAADNGYFGGDPHLHFPRQSDDDEGVVFDLLEAEDIRYGTVLAYNDPPGPYRAEMGTLVAPQRELGSASERSRGAYHIVSGQEYRSSTYGHLNLFLRPDLVLPGMALNADNWPWYGDVARETQRLGGYAIYAHGGYAQAIYADVLTGDVNAVELLQFGVYRGIGLEDWYHLLNVGFRVPCVGASDYPACRALGDCRTYVWLDTEPSFPDWLKGAALGRAFVSTGPILLLEVDDKRPGTIIENSDPRPPRYAVKVRVRCDVAPVTDVQLVVGGKVTKRWSLPPNLAHGRSCEFTAEVDAADSTWIAARAFSTAPCGTPDAESHTNPVYVYRHGRAPFDRSSLESLIQKIDGQVAAHQARPFKEQADVINRFTRAREVLVRLGETGGMTADVVPSLVEHPSNRQAFDPSSRTHSDEDLAEFLRPVPSLTPEEAQATFDVRDGFRMELVAAEPLVVDPVAAAFDEHGNLYVCEMRDYPYLPHADQAPQGTVRLLRDTNGDGRMDESHVFADKLLWSAGVMPWKDGVFVAAPPDIWYLRDTDGDFVADERRKVYTGFGTQNQQGMLNNLVMGLDHKIYGATAVNGGKVRKVEEPTAEAINLDGRDFRFDPVTEALEPVTGTVQFGNAMDDWGNRFLCSESMPFMHAVLPHEYLVRNPYLPVPYALVRLVEYPVPCFRTSPLERWRIIRSSRRITHGERPPEMAGASHHVIDASAGPVVYRGGAYPPEMYGQIFVGDAQNNLIHRRRLVPDGVTFKGERIDDQTEFARSTDNWFRPVNMFNAPDGTLYVLDLSREILESIHIPADVVRHLDLTRGRDQGRIYRLAPNGFQYPGVASLGAASTTELVAALESPHGWWRDTAHRLLFERQDPAAAEPLRQIAKDSPHAASRVAALWSLQGLAALRAEDVLVGLADAVPQVREHAIRLSEPLLDDERVLTAVIGNSTHDNQRVRFQAAFSLGATGDPRAAAALVELACRDAADTWMRQAILSSAGESSGTILQALLHRDAAKLGAASEMLDELAAVVGSRHDPHEIGVVLSTLAAESNLGASSRSRTLLANVAVASLNSGVRLSEATFANAPGAARKFIAGQLETAAALAVDEYADEAGRLNAIQLLATGNAARARPILLHCLHPSHPTSVQLAALDALSRDDASEVANELLVRQATLVPEVRAALIRALLSREAWTLRLLEEIQSGLLPVGEIDPADRLSLTSGASESVRQVAANLFSAPAGREEVLATYESCVAAKGDAARGREHFRKHCVSCHKLQGEGHEVGPDLTSSTYRDPSAMLTHILDPNRYVLPRYAQYTVVDISGRIFTGLIASQTATSVTIRRDQGIEHTILRSQIDELSAQGKSLMPDGLETRIATAEMTDLLAFLLSAQATAKSPPLEIGTEPGLIEPP